MPFSYIEKGISKFVDRPGLEPGLFCTKNRRVANYTIGHYYPVWEYKYRNHFLKCKQMQKVFTIKKDTAF